MTLKTTTTTDNASFDNYTWFPGKNRRFNAACVSTHEGRVFLGLKGYDKKRGGPGYIQAEFDLDQVAALHARLGELLAEPQGA